MTAILAANAARRPRAAFILGASLLVFGLSGGALLMAQTNSPPATAAPAITATPPAQHARPGQPLAHPLWSELNPIQQQALAPLAGEWDQLDSFRKNKWLAIGNKYHSMKPDEQARMQERMRDWVRLTPEQRKIARESYVRAKKLDSNQKTEQWQQYQQLPEEQKKRLAENAAARKKVATLPSAHSQAKTGTPVPPIKSAPKPVIEQSVTPQATTQAPLQTQDAASANK
ncbi:DUF3106 domain-containing protein [Noviherbaspirillum galbum]|uniref:DUF3106 domain-containing protein n=1 Tax=Noviherbaspirillum galbum TaxID=2709383 RepID=A0A6B3SR68_9BURK|nr:DUF3106 domain-containing protein [Noviherbaspirillum galbum]NEX61825.1 DUF3106 domain-containing protein [Noviherbaspirillum galbum]